MSTIFTPEQRLAMLNTAIISAGPGATPEQITEQVSLIAHLSSPASMALDNAIDEVERRLAKVTEWKKFLSTIIYVDREITSNRAVIVLQSKPSNENPSGQEAVRTNIVAFDPVAKNLANLAATHIGHKVLVNMAIEKMDNSNKVRVLHDLQLRGVDEAFTGQPAIDWAQLRIDPSKLQLASQPVQG